MGKKVKNLLNLVAIVTGILVSLAVGFAMTTNGALNQGIPFVSGIGNGIIVAIAGWVIIVSTLVSAALALLKQ